MSKEPETKDDVGMGDPGEDKPRRRRKGGGLRVPSDNVPRRVADGQTASTLESPQLAASVADSFAPTPHDHDPLEEMPTMVSDDDRDEGMETVLEDDGLATVIPNSDPDTSEARGGRPDTEESPLEDDSAASPEPPSADRPLAAVFEDDTGMTMDSGLAAYEERLSVAPVDLSMPTSEVPLIDDVDVDEEDQEQENAEAAGEISERDPSAPDGDATRADLRPAPRGSEVSGDSVDIPFDDDETTVTAPAPPLENDTEMDDDAAPLRRQLLVPSAPVVAKMAEVDQGASGKGRRFIRARTMALSDSDFEVIDEPVASEPVEAPRNATDSGEILADDMLEEIPDATDSSDVTTSATRQHQRPDTAEPPPPPAVKAKPPVKPPPAPAGRAAAVAAVGAPNKDRRRRGKPWFEEIFDEDYLRTLPFLTPQATQFEANFVMESLGVEPGAQVLDVGCGYGRHAMELAARGYHVVGLDSSLPLLLRGADEAQRRGLTINFVHGDMREMSFESQFDGAYCLFSSFGYFDDETNKKTAQNIAKALKPGARLVVEVLNRDYLVADLPSRVWWEGDGCVVLEEVEFNYFSSRIVSNRSVVFDDGRQLEQEISLRSFSLHELGKFLHAVGFRVLEISGSMSTRGRFFGAHSRDIVVVAERRAPKEDAPAS